MNLCVFTAVLGDKTAEETFSYLNSLGVNHVEIGTGGYPGNAHIKYEEMINDEKAYNDYLALLKKYNMTITALSCHANPIHPDKAIAAEFQKDLENTVLLAEKMGIDTIVSFSGCAGDCEDSKYPNWVTCPWPDDFGKILEWQWNEVLIPYWKKMAAFAAEHGIKKIALEAHPGFMVYNPETMLKLRAAVGDIMGINFDPSHFFWQGIEPIAAVKELAGAIHHVHAKDTRIDPVNSAINGNLDNKSYADIKDRSWVFRTVGYGHDQKWWNDFISALKTVGYDGAISIEHEDGLMSSKEGLEKAIAFLKNVIIFEKNAGMWWI